MNTYKTVTDAWNGYHSVPLREEDRHLSTFITTFGRYRYKRAPQGFVSSGDGYNRRFSAIISDFERKERCVDDTVHYDTDLKEHWWRTIHFLRKVGQAGIVLNPSKFQFSQKEVSLPGSRYQVIKLNPFQNTWTLSEPFLFQEAAQTSKAGLAWSTRSQIMQNCEN